MNTTTGVFGSASGFADTRAMSPASTDHYAALRRQIQGVFLLGSTFASTTSAHVTVVTASPAGIATAPSITDGARTAAQELVASIHGCSGLKLEEIATLLGATRRSLQHWRAGEAINSSNERRLRLLAAAIRQIDAGDPAATRKRLLDHAEGEVSPFGLLAEERFDLAVAVATGRSLNAPVVEGDGARPELAARFSANEEAQPLAAGRPSGRRLRRG